MKKIIFKICFSFLSSVLFFSCNKKNNLKEYEALKIFGIQSNNLFNVINEYDIKHPDFFESKSDLASLYVLSNDLEKASEFIKRAEQVHKKSLSKEALCNHYALWSSVEFKKRNYEKSLSLCRQAEAIKPFGNKYGFLEGQILFAENENKKALNAFKNSFAFYPENASAEDLRIYFYLLSENEEYDESIIYFNKLLESGNYFYGLGQAASSIYEKKEMYFEAVLSAFLDYEYVSSFEKTDNSKFLKNLTALNLKFKNSGEIKKATECINAGLNKQVKFPEYFESDFIVYKYLKIKNKILNNIQPEENLTAILNFKTYFENFPVYHYLVAEAYLNSASDGTPAECFEAILNISQNNVYSEYAKNHIGESLGLNKKESLCIKTIPQIKNSFNKIINDNNENEINELCSLLTLPDNKYVFFAEEILKESKNNLYVKNFLEDKYKSADSRLKERLEYILFQ